MAKFRLFKILKTNNGQSFVEYILLMAIIASFTFTILHNKKFKAFIKGDAGLFASMKKGMMYSYRYGRDLRTTDNYEAAMSFEYTSTNHEHYLNKKNGSTHFFMGTLPYGEH